MHAQIDQFVSSIELQQAKLDNEVKDLKLRNFQLIKSLFVASLLGVLVVGLLLLRLKARKRKIERLQTYIHKSVLSRFLPPLMVDEIVQGRSRLESDPHEQVVTVMFADLVGFTEISGKLGAQSSAYILNHFMQKISEVIYDNAGTIDKFIGDAVMVIFGAPYQIPAEEQALQSLACAKAMLHAIEELNQDFLAKFNVNLSIRVGINHGQAIVGTFGGLKRSDYTAIGPTVNIASRIEGKALPGQILVGPELARLVPAAWLEEPIQTQLRGISEPVPLFPAKVHAIGRAVDHPRKIS
jgi:class 3 adenylate cyclase